MYFSGKLEIDPSQITVFKKVKPSKLFGRLVDVMSFGALTPKQEHETFTAVSILQQIYLGLRSLEIKNLVRLAVDDYDFYFDDSGIEDDLETAINNFKSKIDPIESKLFNTISIVLEHESIALKYLIEISIHRKHKIGEYPINIYINGIIKEFTQSNEESMESLQQRIDNVMLNQQTYDDFILLKYAAFEQYLNLLTQSLRKYVRVDDVRKVIHNNILRPVQIIDKAEKLRHSKTTEPLFYGYFNYDYSIFYTYFWAMSLYNNNIYIKNCFIVDEIGRPIISIGESGFSCGQTDTLNINAPLEAPLTGDLAYFNDNDFDIQLEAANLLPLFVETEMEPIIADSENDWLNYDFDTVDNIDSDS